VNCPVCKATDSRVVDSRLADDGSAVRRRRECVQCGRRFTTYERLEVPPIFVIKKDGRREPFEREKILAGITKACEKRPVAREEIERVVDEIERTLRDRLATEVPTRELGAMVMDRLRALDEVAYVRFASVYKDFRDADSFVQEIERLTGPKAEQ
jgi:transcriptional repressor NrdR